MRIWNFQSRIINVCGEPSFGEARGNPRENSTPVTRPVFGTVWKKVRAGLARDKLLLKRERGSPCGSFYSEGLD